jgi:hypothetical protein
VTLHQPKTRKDLTEKMNRYPELHSSDLATTVSHLASPDTGYRVGNSPGAGFDEHHGYRYRGDSFLIQKSSYSEYDRCSGVFADCSKLTYRNVQGSWLTGGIVHGFDPVCCTT